MGDRVSVVEAKGNPGAVVGQVLIADDDADFRQLLVARATKMGLEVVEAEDGLRALNALQRIAFDAVVVDLYMPGRSGLEIAQAAQHVDPDLPVIVLTGSATVETAIEALRSGVHDYLTKPLESLAAFELSLTRALEHRYLLKENARLFMEVQRLAVTDPLTGLYNRHKFEDAIGAEVERASRYDRPLSLIMIDMDGLKKVNDTYGHPAGDQLLKDVADLIREQLRKVDLPVRFGGDEFLILLPEADLQVASRVAERLSARIRSLAVHGSQVTASMGVAQWEPALGSPQGLLHAVDQALYQSKRSGKSRLSVVRVESDSGEGANQVSKGD
jgi:diguanylate cyclase (GGDEF)-like protein